MNNSRYQLQNVTDPKILDEIYQFRARVWSESHDLAPDAFPSGKWQDRHDENAQHWAVFDSQGKIAGSARLTLHQALEDVVEPEQYLRYGVECDGLIAAPDRVVVCPAARRQGIANRLLDVQDQAALAAAAVCAIRQASPAMCRLIQKREWQLLGPASIDPRFPDLVFTVAMRAFQANRVRIRTRQNEAAA